MSAFTVINSLRDKHIAKLAELEAALKSSSEEEAASLSKAIEEEQAEIDRLTRAMWAI